MAEKTRMIFVNSGKGGCGKTVTTMALLDYLMSKKIPVFLIETDTSNPDVAQAYEGSVPTEPVNLDRSPGRA